MDHAARDELIRTLGTLADVLIAEARRSDEVRAALRGLHSAVGRAIDAADAGGTADLERGQDPPGSESRATIAPPARQVEKPLLLGGQEHVVSVADAPGAPAAAAAEPLADGAAERERQQGMIDIAAWRAAMSLPDLRLVARRCRLKAAACEWAVQRRKRLAEGADHQQAIKPTDERLMGEARAIENCYLWMLDPYGPVAEDRVLQHLAGTYENLALACDLANRSMAEHGEEAEPPVELLDLMAEAQSALRAGLVDAGLGGPDYDQNEAFLWLRRQTEQHRIYVHRHMRLEDPADPSAWLDLQERLEAQRQEWDQREGRTRRRREMLNRIKYHIGRLAAADPEDAEHDWGRILQTMAGWTESGLPPSDREMCELLLSVVDEMPEDAAVPEPAQRVLEAVDRLAAQRQALSTAPAQAERARSEPVRQAAELLRGRVVALVGGEFRPHAKAALERDLELAELRWIEAPPHKSISALEGKITPGQVDLVMLAIRWCSHSHGDLKDICDRQNIPFVRLPAGYASEQVAHQILRQVSRQLADSHA